MKTWENSSCSESRTPSVLFASRKELLETNAMMPRSSIRSDAQRRARK